MMMVTSRSTSPSSRYLLRDANPEDLVDARALVSRAELVDIVDDGGVDVPADEIDRGQRRHRAAGVATYQLVHQERAVLLGELRDLVEHLEAHSVAGEAGRVRRSGQG